MSAAGRSSISAHRRSLMTATAAGAVLCALWFVPSAKATQEVPGGAHHAVTSHSETSSTLYRDGSGRDRTSEASAARDGQDGSSTPFVLSTLGLAGAGGAMVARARRRRGGSGAG